MKEYKSLEYQNEYDTKKAEDFADLMNELEDLKERVTYLNELAQSNVDLVYYLWRTADGRHIALHKIKDDHLENIMNHLIETGRKIKKEIKAEARKRGMKIPNDSDKVLQSKYPRAIEAEIIDDDLWDN